MLGAQKLLRTFRCTSAVGWVNVNGLLACAVFYYPFVRQNVRAGDPIALSGNTGFTAGPHLHFDAVDILPQESECCGFVTVDLFLLKTEGSRVLRSTPPPSRARVLVCVAVDMLAREHEG